MRCPLRCQLFSPLATPSAAVPEWSALPYRRWHINSPVDASGSKKRRIQLIRSVGGSQDQHVTGALNAIHLVQERRQHLGRMVSQRGPPPHAHTHTHTHTHTSARQNTRANLPTLRSQPQQQDTRAATDRPSSPRRPTSASTWTRAQNPTHRVTKPEAAAQGRVLPTSSRNRMAGAEARAR
jgi:hypothetical protein